MNPFAIEALILSDGCWQPALMQYMLQVTIMLPSKQQLGVQLVHLYRHIIRLHKAKLPLPLQDLGNTYVRDEFRRHRDEQTTEQQWAIFRAEWLKYVAMISGEADMVVSGDISEEVLQNMTQEQKIRLKVLEEEARKALDNVLQDSSRWQCGCCVSEFQEVFKQASKRCTVLHT